MNIPKGYLYFLLFLSIIGIFQSCIEKPVFNITPEIEFLAIENIRVGEGLTAKDSIIISVKFKDGDGDLGLKDEDTLAPYSDFITNNEGIEELNMFRHNYFIDFYRQEGEEFVKVEFPDPTLNFNGRFPYLNEPETEGGPLEGVLSYTFDITPSPLIPNNSVLKFEVTIADRALNLSNVIETDTVLVNQN